MSISVYIATKPDWEELVTVLLREQYNQNEAVSRRIYQNNLKPHFDALKNDICFLAETDYVDFFYRDSYYHYFSSKLKPYSRDCIRLSLFSGEVSEEDFIDPLKYDFLKKKYQGFYVLRPTFPHIMGRSVISPKALNNNDIRICSCIFNTTVNGLKFQVCGFPHSSQDTEIITCAETTLWEIMEYFGCKYSYYKPTLPSKIIQELNSVSFERQIPSKGLTVHQISFVLKEFGFGTRIYSKEDYDLEFEGLLSCYVESGIPLVVAIENDEETIAHTLLVVGREDDCSVRLDDMHSVGENKDIDIFDYDSVQKKFVFVDDNMPVYQKAFLSNPTGHYFSEDWRNCRISHFIVPLYPKIYLEAYEAKRHVKELLLSGLLQFGSESSIVMKVFLASSRSYKHELMRGKGVRGELRTLILETQLPKFIWVGEISTKPLIREKRADGLMILDATEPNRHYNPLIMAAYGGRLLEFQNSIGIYHQKVLYFEPFTIYAQNLKSLDYAEENQ